jgi:glycosyltransferase involved in cell wall biosynthesis
MTSPAFTVVTKAYNEEALVGDAIRSALAQTREDFELIVVDDGSTDRTADVVRGFESDSRVRLVSQPNRGVGAAMNTGIAAGQAPYVALLDADDLWMPTYLELMGAALDADEDAGVGYTDAWWLDDASGRFFKRTISERLGAPADPPQDPGEFLKALMHANWMFGLTTMRRSALERVGGVDESLLGAEDYELWIRMLASGYRAVRVPGRLAIQRDRSGSMSANERGMLTSLRQVYEGALQLPGVPEEARQVARRQVAEIDRQLATLDRGRRPARQIVRGMLGRTAKEVLVRHYWYPETPPEVAAAFPDLSTGRR